MFICQFLPTTPSSFANCIELCFARTGTTVKTNATYCFKQNQLLGIVEVGGTVNYWTNN